MKSVYESQGSFWPFNLLGDLFGEGISISKMSAQEMDFIVRYVLELALPPRNEAIVRMRYEKGLSAAEIGELYGISTQQVLTILDSAFQVLRKPKCTQQLKLMPPEREHSSKETFPSSDIEKLNLKTRLKNSLLRKGICSLEELMETDVQSLLKIRGIGAVGIKDIAEALESLGLDSSHLQADDSDHSAINTIKNRV